MSNFSKYLIRTRGGRVVRMRGPPGVTVWAEISGVERKTAAL
jgi:hypothetical protein